MGVHDVAREQLASAHMAFAHGRLRNVPPESSRPSPRQHPLSRGERGAAFHADLEADQPSRRRFGSAGRRVVAGRVCHRAVCVASPARRIRRVDFRTQGRIKRLLCVADTFKLHTICRGVQSPKSKVQGFLLAGVAGIRTGPDEQADARHAAVFDVAPGLLAAAKSCRLQVAGCTFTS